MAVALAALMMMAVLAASSSGVAEAATTWTQVGAADIDGETATDQSGWSVAMSSDGNTVAIGAVGNDGAGSSAGHVRIYDWDGGAWVQRGADIDGEAAGDRSGWSVGMSNDGNTIIIGAPGNDGAGTFAGHVRIYDWDGSAWVQRGADIDGEAAFDQSGSSVEMSSDGNTIIIGAPGNFFSAGHARIYDWDGSAWVQRGADIDGEAAGDQSGSSVGMSSDGNTVIIGAPFNDGAGTDAGHARIYDWDGSAWVQRGADIDGEAAGDQSGYSVGMSSDGNTVIIGAPFNDGAGTDAGHARIYTTPLSPEALISALGDAVQDLLDSGELTADQADALQGKLDAATDKLDQGQPANAIKKLEDFIAKVERWVNGGKVDAAVGAELTASAQAVIDAINAS